MTDPGRACESPDRHSMMQKRKKRDGQLNVAQIWLNLSGFWSSLYASQRPDSLMIRSLAFSKLCSGRHAPRVLLTSTRSSAGVFRDFASRLCQSAAPCVRHCYSC